MIINTMGGPSRISSKPSKVESVFGLDVDILKSLNLEELISSPVEEKKKASPQAQVDSGAAHDMMNMTIDDLRQMHGIQPEAESSV